jgi:hypothetical protein
MPSGERLKAQGDPLPRGFLSAKASGRSASDNTRAVASLGVVIAARSMGRAWTEDA